MKSSINFKKFFLAADATVDRPLIFHPVFWGPFGFFLYWLMLVNREFVLLFSAHNVFDTTNDGSPMGMLSYELGQLGLLVWPPTQLSVLVPVLFSVALCCRLFYVCNKFNGSKFGGYLISAFSFLFPIPFAATLTWVMDLYVNHLHDTFAGLMSGLRHLVAGVSELITSTASLALDIGCVLVIGYLLKFFLFPTAYLRRGDDGLVIGSNAWSWLLGEKHFSWNEIESVQIKSNAKQKRSIKLRFNNGNYKFGWNELEQTLDPAELMNDLKTHAPNAIASDFDSSCVPHNSLVNSHEYTELWLKYFTSSSTRDRVGALQPGDRLHEGRYEIAGELGQGGQGTAYLTSSASSDEEGSAPTTIVLKEYILPVHRGEAILQQSMKKLSHEAEILAKIHHPNIVEIKDTFVEDHRGYLVLEYVHGDVLKQLVHAQGPLSEQQVIDIALQVCDALEHLHGMEPAVIHRDLTPDNLILQPDGRVKLVDFNVAQQLEPSATSTVVGKHAYIPPEQFRGKPSKQSDIFALGGTLFFLLTGQEPEPLSVSHPRVLNETVSPGLDDIVARATVLDQTGRFADASAVRAALMALSALSDDAIKIDLSSAIIELKEKQC